MLRPKKYSCKEFDNKKKFLRLKNSPPPHNFSNGPSLTHMELAPWNSQAHRAFFCFGKSRIQWVAGHAAVIVGRVGTKRYCPDYNSLAAVSLYAFIS